MKETTFDRWRSPQFKTTITPFDEAYPNFEKSLEHGADIVEVLKQQVVKRDLCLANIKALINASVDWYNPKDVIRLQDQIRTLLTYGPEEYPHYIERWEELERLEAEEAYKKMEKHNALY